MLNQKDSKFISQLRKNSRQTLTELSKSTGIPITTLFDKLRYHESNESGVIKKHTSLLDFEKLGFNSRFNFMVKINKANRDTLIGYLSKHPSINNIYRINSGFDLLFEVIFSNIKEVEEFNDELITLFKFDKIERCQILQDVKREEFDILKK